MAQRGGQVAADYAPGSVIAARYRVERVLGVGGAGTAYLVEDCRSRRHVALKVVRRGTADGLEILRAEFSLLRRLRHPNLVSVLDFARLVGTEDGTGAYFTAELVPGRTLAELLQGEGGSPRWASIRQVLADALSALRLLHAAGIRHGDFTPANVMVRPDGTGVLIDLSCAARVGSALSSISGTPGSLAPEVLDGGQPVDHRADLFAVGVTLRAVIDRVVDKVDAATGRIAAALVAKNPLDRPADVAEVLEALGVELSAQPAVPIGLGNHVGRDAEMRSLRAVVAAVAQGTSGARVVLIDGPEGMGKTRLLEELRWEAEGRFLTLETCVGSHHAISELLAAALRLDQPPRDVESVLEAWERLRRRPQPATVLFIDDADRLGEYQLEILLGLIRSIEPADPVLVIASCETPLDVPTDRALRLTLNPLGLGQVRDWLGADFSEATTERMWSLSGGSPGALRGLLDDLASRALHLEELNAPDVSIRVSSDRLERVHKLSAMAQHALAALAIAGARLTDPVLRALGVAPTAEQELLLSGLALRDGSGLGLALSGEGPRLAAALAPSLVSAAHRDVATWIAQSLAAEGMDRPTRAELLAREVRHLALGGRVDEALERFDAARTLHEVAPRTFCQALSILCGLRHDAHLELTLSRLERATGTPEKAHQRLQKLLTALAGSEPRAAVELEIALSLLDRGEVSAAEEQLEALAQRGGETGVSAKSALARSLLRRGRYREAATTAGCAASACKQPSERAALLQTSALAHSFLGEPRLARQELEQAAALITGTDHPRQLVRLLGVRAVVAYELGELDDAARFHTEAVRLADEQSLTDQLATSLLNLATVHHQRGEWGAALSVYERGLRTAVAIGQVRTEALLRFNLAKLYLDLGLLDRSALASERCEAVACAAELTLIAAEAIAVRGELELLRRNAPEARQALETARKLIAQHGSARECLELDLHLAELALMEGQPDVSARLLDTCKAEAERAQARDVGYRCRLLLARLELGRGDPARAGRLLENLAQGAAEAGLLDLQAEAELLHAEIFEAAGARLLAQEHGLLARKIWERNALSLPPTLRPAFWSHPKRAPVQAIGVVASSAGSRREQKLERMLEINKWLNSVLDVNGVLERAMDAALELTRAERGFVLLLDELPSGQRFRVAVSRHLDRARVDDPIDVARPPTVESRGSLAEEQGRFSRAIAERVVTSGVPVVTANALEDERFRGQKSVHAMRLRSVLCVPVVSPEQTLGALYLDNRLERSRFGDEDLQILVAFADQVAIALSNARLHAAIEQRNQELERERGRVEELLRSQAAELDRLSQEVESRKRSLEQRYDYSRILGSGPAMQRLFTLLDRVIETDMPVLIEGESGTGKELVARAIHTNDKRRRGPLVCINCAAMPDTLLEAELFGYQRGAFTGADRNRDGLFVQANGGTLFLDELGELPLSMQAKLLRVLQEREVRPLGSERVVAVDVRLVSATNRRLRDEVVAGRFREDLYYRVSGVEIALPALRQRREDIPVLVRHFLSSAATQLGRAVPDLTRQALERLTAHPWPGNVRQLEHVVTRAVALTDASRVTVTDLELPPEGTSHGTLDRTAFELHESEQIAQALSENRFNVSKVSRLLTIPRATLWRKMRRYGLVRSQ